MKPFLVTVLSVLVVIFGCSRDQIAKIEKKFDPRFPGKAATHIVQLDRVQIGARDFNLSTFGNPLDITIALLEDGRAIGMQEQKFLSGRRGERMIQPPIQWVVNFDPSRNYQVVLTEQSVIAKAAKWSIPGTPRLGYWPIAEGQGLVKFGTESYLHFTDKVAQ